MRSRNLTCLAVLLGGFARAQEQPQDQGARLDGREVFRDLLAQADQLEPARRLGMRAVLHLTLHAVIPDVVIVPNEGAYLKAIEAWDPNHFFPVLIDDGSARAREDIARFVRAFGARRVVRWDPGVSLPDKARDSRRAIETSVARAWNIDAELPTWAAMIEHWVSNDLTPQGIILAHENDPAWTAAAALAAARAEPIAWVTWRGVPGGKMSAEEAATLASRIEAELAATGLTWRGLGDDIDAITICLHSQTKVEPKEGELLATTDVIGRTGVDGRERYAWCSQIYGDAPHAAYMAMCSLFIQPTKAWLFDGYRNQGAFADWDATKASEVLRERGLETRLFDEPGGDATTWRRECATALDAQLILVNTQGMRDYFELNPGRVYPGDVPILGEPALVHFVHSWSANGVTNRDTVAGRWLERGCFGYVGSVQEPYLQAFVPTPVFANRFIHGYPWGAAGRIDGAPPWKIASIGDPLYVMNPQRRVEDPLPLESAADLEVHAREALKGERFAEGAADFIMLGRDADVLRLVTAMLKERPEAVTPELLSITIPAAFRLGRHEDVRRMCVLLAPGTIDPELQDMLWLATLPDVASTGDQALLALLRSNLREGQGAQDAIALAPAVARASGPGAAIAMLNEARMRAQNKREERAIDDAIKALGGP